VFIDKVKEIFNPNEQLSPNLLIRPNKICITSILGLFLRLFLARWDCLSFEDACQFYDNMHKCLTSKSDNNSTLSYTTSDFCCDRYSNENCDVLNIDDNLSHGDIFPAEEFIHQMFDFNGTDPLSFQPLSSSSPAVATSVSSALNAVMLARLPQITSNRHQQAMLNLASMWVRNGNYNLAFSAIEEAMKIAHQRGDHATVAKALYLLYFVLSNVDSNINNGNESSILTYKKVVAEEFLYRCVDRCVESHMNLLASQAAISLARANFKKPLQNILLNYMLNP
jgi:hypothetical protein